jgi:hypothetical protein
LSGAQRRRLYALVPRSWLHLIRFDGVLLSRRANVGSRAGNREQRMSLMGRESPFGAGESCRSFVTGVSETSATDTNAD